MQALTADEIAMVFGGDNPGMGPYKPPITPEMMSTISTYLVTGAALSFGLLTAGIGQVVGVAVAPGAGTLAGGAAGGTAGYVSGPPMNASIIAALQQENVQNGYTPDGSQYIYSSGGGYNISVSDNVASTISAATLNNLIDCIAGLSAPVSLSQIIGTCYAGANASFPSYMSHQPSGLGGSIAFPGD